MALYLDLENEECPQDHWARELLVAGLAIELVSAFCLLGVPDAWWATWSQQWGRPYPLGLV